MTTLYQSDLNNLDLLFRGKVRDIYDLGEELLIVTTDRLSAFDVVLPDPIPAKGEVLNQLSLFWMKHFQNKIPNHLANQNRLEELIPKEKMSLYKNRSVIVKKAKSLPVECVVRGYLIGSGWKDYQKTGQVCGVNLPKGLKMAEKLPELIFTPATKASVGDHDENVDFDHVVNLIGKDTAKKIRDLSFEIYKTAFDYAKARGILIADTKFEFGIYNDEVILIDEVLTPDSSRFWPEDQYQVGKSPPSFDKQFVRDYLETLDWNKAAPGPNLPEEIQQKTAQKYNDVLNRLTNSHHKSNS